MRPTCDQKPTGQDAIAGDAAAVKEDAIEHDRDDVRGTIDRHREDERRRMIEDDRLADIAERDALEKIDKPDAVELLEIELFRRRKPYDDPTITLPIAVWLTILAAAKAGMRKGSGRRRPPDSQWIKKNKQSIVALARRRMDQLIATGTMNATDAEEQAAKEASDVAGKRHGINLAASTIKRMMQEDPAKESTDVDQET
jgi:hypothetical protein